MIPFSTYRCRLSLIIFIPLSMKRCSTSLIVTSYLPDSAKTWLIPCPIKPAPRTVTCFISIQIGVLTVPVTYVLCVWEIQRFARFGSVRFREEGEIIICLGKRLLSGDLGILTIMRLSDIDL